MSTNLYETLGIQTDATDDQIRKAYKKRALQTHPDRAPPEQKTIAEDEFRKVNNAYEVLRDPAKREAYDAAGVWPPPPPGSGGSRHRRRPHRSNQDPWEQPVPFPEDHFDFPWFHHSFTDPFRLFESIFGDLHRAMSDPFLSDPWRRDRRHDMPRQRGRSFFDDFSIGTGFPFDRDFDDMVNPGGGRARVYSQVSRGTMTPDGRWVGESRMMYTVDGVTESVWKRQDAAGNEYATYTYPNGRERRTINGREQLPQQHVPPQRIRRSQSPPGPPPGPPPPIQTTSLPPPPPYSSISRKRDSPTSVSGRKREGGSREHQSPIEIPPSHSGSPPPISHHYRPPAPPPPLPASHDRSYVHETPHYKSRWWKK
ncbi:hypothetical protein F5148DRAFT_1219613 [Russula earlei]|uniref:Uncharacterized protein n=1 Tax=Russula earlei TaxID=71964 RepID=A0ACC0U4L0_9AGAM|nr:hypothetical protein F5148DRAFT_1219613 [Russula earlei]